MVHSQPSFRRDRSQTSVRNVTRLRTAAGRNRNQSISMEDLNREQDLESAGGISDDDSLWDEFDKVGRTSQPPMTTTENVSNDAGNDNQLTEIYIDTPEPVSDSEYLTEEQEEEEEDDDNDSENLSSTLKPPRRKRFPKLYYLSWFLVISLFIIGTAILIYDYVIKSKIPSTSVETPFPTTSLRPTMSSSKLPSVSPSISPHPSNSFHPTDTPSTALSPSPSSISFQPSTALEKTTSPIMGFTPFPSPAKSSEPTNLPSHLPTPFVFREKRQLYTTILESISDPANLRNPNSPQFKAADWIIFTDPQQLAPNHPDVRQRYILAVFYFASNVDPSGDTISWKRCGSESMECEEVFLSEKHVCDWFGITCHENNDVKRISLRKLSPCLVILYLYIYIVLLF